MSTLLVRPSKTGDVTGELLTITRKRAGWKTISLRLIRLRNKERLSVSLPNEELVFVTLAGQVTISTKDNRWGPLGGRPNVFGGMPHALYLPARSGEVEVEASTSVCEVALCSAVARQVMEPLVIQPSAVEIEVRGGENATRQINHIVKPEFPADRILVVEVYTPGGNWSSYPPHKHDTHNPPLEVDLDEIYFYKMSRPEGYAIQRVYNSSHSLDETITVHDNEAVLVPEGYHPVVAAHGYDCYYLNVLAGSARSMAASDDPAFAWVRDTWQTKDPRVPVTR